jgi:hypothetical protein
MLKWEKSTLSRNRDLRTDRAASAAGVRFDSRLERAQNSFGLAITDRDEAPARCTVLILVSQTVAVP